MDQYSTYLPTDSVLSRSQFLTWSTDSMQPQSKFQQVFFYGYKQADSKVCICGNAKGLEHNFETDPTLK